MERFVLCWEDGVEEGAKRNGKGSWLHLMLSSVGTRPPNVTLRLAGGVATRTKYPANADALGA